MKRYIFTIVIVVLCVLVLGTTLASCTSSQGRYVVEMCISQQDSTSFSMSYDRFDGYRIYRINVERVATMRVFFVTESGRLDYVITDSSGDVYMQQQDVVSYGFDFEMPKGQYTVRLDADNHAGSFSFSWEYFN